MKGTREREDDRKSKNAVEMFCCASSFVRVNTSRRFKRRLVVKVGRKARTKWAN